MQYAPSTLQQIRPMYIHCNDNNYQMPLLQSNSRAAATCNALNSSVQALKQLLRNLAVAI